MALTMSAVLAGSTARAVAGAVASRVAALVLGIAVPPITPLLIIGAGAIAAQMIVMSWNQTANDKMQSIAMEKYCALPSAERTQGLCAVGFTVKWENYSSYRTAYTRVGSSENYGAYEVRRETGESDANSRYAWQMFFYDRANNDFVYAGYVNPNTVEEIPDNPSTKKPWAEWSLADRQRAVSLLDNADFLQAMSEMPIGSSLAPGDILANDHILSGDPDDADSARRNPSLVPAGTRVPDPTLNVPATRGDLQNLRNELSDPNSALNAAIAGAVAGATLGGLSGALGAGGMAGLGNNARRAADNAGAAKTAADSAKAAADTANDKLDDQGEKQKKAINFANFDRILQLMIWWQTLHNAFMLSADVSRSLVSGISLALQALPGDSLFGVSTEASGGQPLDLGAQLSGAFETWCKGAIGTENYAVMKAELIKVNRIYQSASNVVTEMQNITNNLQNITEMGANNTGKIGNALMRFGVIGDNAYAAMSENMDSRTSWWGKASKALEQAQAVASNFEQVAQSVVEIGTSVEQAKVHAREFGKAVGDTPLKDIRPSNLTRPLQGDQYQDENIAAKQKMQDELGISITPGIDLDNL